MERLFLAFSADKLRQLKSRIDECLERLTEEQIWYRPSEENNSIANLVLHLTGNVRQWIISAVGGAQDSRQRDAEFAARGEANLLDLRAKLTDAVAQASNIIETLPVERLMTTVHVQGYDKTVMEAIYHVVGHFAEHTGQIIYITKSIRKEDLGFYRHLNATKHTEKTP
jgi:uncharacterized damage-inducible protein DinB